jgi:hypothetical protein
LLPALGGLKVFSPGQSMSDDRRLQRHHGFLGFESLANFIRHNQVFHSSSVEVNDSPIPGGNSPALAAPP